jgi:hypothetical protein
VFSAAFNAAALLLHAALQIVQRMFCVTLPAGSTILLQNAQPSADDCMYYLAQGQAEVVIMGTVDAASKQGRANSAAGGCYSVLGMSKQCSWGSLTCTRQCIVMLPPYSPAPQSAGVCCDQRHLHSAQLMHVCFQPQKHEFAKGGHSEVTVVLLLCRC